jgi:hypothetical protein
MWALAVQYPLVNAAKFNNQGHTRQNQIKGGMWCSPWDMGSATS